MCVCVFKISETTRPTEAKFHVAPSLDKGKDGKLIQMIVVIFCYPLLSTPGTGYLAWMLPQI